MTRTDKHLETAHRPVHARNSPALRSKLSGLNRELERELTRASENRRVASQRCPMEGLAQAKAAESSYLRAAALTRQMIEIHLSTSFYDWNEEPAERGVYDVEREEEGK